MSRPTRITLFTFLIAGLGGLAWLMFVSHVSDPLYEGKPLSFWLEAAANSDRRGSIGIHYRNDAERELDKAVLAVGTNAIPVLLRGLRARDWDFRHKMLNLGRSLRLVRRASIPSIQLNYEAAMAFRLLGVNASNAVPALSRIIDQDVVDAGSVDAACDYPCFTAWVLGSIGPTAKPAIPSLLRALLTTNRVDRANVIFAIDDIHPDAEVVVPALIAALERTNFDAKVLVAETLENYRVQARQAVPTLILLSSDQKEGVRTAAAHALKSIDPEAAAKASIK